MQRKYILLLTLLSMLFFAPASAQNGQDTTKFGRNDAAGRYVNTRGFKMYYETYGKGEPVLLIHGNSNSIKNMENQIPYFAKSYQVIVADSRAQGRSADGQDSLSYEMMTDDLNALLDTLHLKSCYVIGWSDGGINGLLLAMRHPYKVKKLAVTGANLWPDTTAVDPFIAKWAMDIYTKGVDSLKKVTPSAEDKNSLKLFNLLVNQPHIKPADLHKITCPVLVIGGDHDVIRVSHTMLIAESIPNSYLWIIPNSGHSTPVRKRNQFNPVVEEFFKKPFRKIEKFGRFD